MLTTTLKLIAIPITLTAAYIFYLDRRISQQTTSETKLFAQGKSKQPLPSSIPSAIKSSKCLIAYERVTSRSIHLPHLDKTPLPHILTRYIRATMSSFSRTPQVFLLKRMIPREDTLTAQTFEQVWIQRCNFELGDRVNGLWRVAYRGSPGGPGEERIELAMEAPAGYWGPVVQGVVVVGVQRVGEGFVFVNETWMWRGRDEKKMLLEGVVGRWFHALLSGWLVGRGVNALMEGWE